MPETGAKVAGGNSAIEFLGSLGGAIHGPPATNLLGVEIILQGTSFSARTDEKGAFAFAGLAAGEYTLVAVRHRFQSTKARVRIEQGKATRASTLILSLDRPLLTGVSPLLVAAGSRIKLVGSHFGSEGSGSLKVFFGPLRAFNVSRESEGVVFATVPHGVVSLTAAPDGTIYAGATNAIWRISGGVATRIAGGGKSTNPVAPARSTLIGTIMGLAVADDSIYALDASRGQLLKIDEAGNLALMAGDGQRRFNGDGPALKASLSAPLGLIAQGNGTLLVTDTGNQRVRRWRP